MEKTSESCINEEFCSKIPKVELHAHINGSLSDATMKELIRMKVAKGECESEMTEKMTSIVDGKRRTLAECFDIFRVVHKIIDNEEAVYKATKDVIKDFANDGVKYLELRSTPKEVGSMTKDVYMTSVLKAINESNLDENLDILTNFLVSIDRRNGAVVAEETIDLAWKYKNNHNCVVGIDLSGDPRSGRSSDFTAALVRAKSLGLKTAVHLAESVEEKKETQDLLDIRPDRIGHGTCLLPEDGGYQDFVDVVVEQRIPLELCLTSNVKAETVKDYDVHHFKKWYDMGHPCIICTDDKGVFTTSLSKEYQIAAEAFQLDQKSLWNLSENAIDFIFSSDDVKEKLRTTWKRQKELLNEEYEL